MAEPAPILEVLHVLTDGASELERDIIAAHRSRHRVRVIDLSAGDVSYDALVEAIFGHHRVISW